MSDQSEEGEYPQFASPPCFAHELEDIISPKEVSQWRKTERVRLLKKRVAMPASVRRAAAISVAERLNRLIPDVSERICSFYWPFRGEPDLRPLMEQWYQEGAACALPCVTRKNSSMEFRPWEPGTQMEPGIWNIPVPVNDEVVMPDLVIAPLVGFDRGNYRLGYGGGYFDRTLAAMSAKPTIIGVGYSDLEMPTIHPQSYDVPMNYIVTETGVI
ncbi:MAG: 5-formyltetrahydrofolate cyclo-ligase [Verrucomicrobiales bacterium]|nr:5-formyltetrahydrofolate cyclo-ligase [Verrucomicrobiales bacterium]